MSMYKNKTRILSLLLAMVMLVSLVPCVVPVAQAAETDDLSAAKTGGTTFSIYRDLNFGDSSAMGWTWWYPNRWPNNTWLGQTMNGADGKGCVTVNNSVTTDRYFDLGQLREAEPLVPASDIVLEQDIYLEEGHPNMALFHMGDNKTISGVDKAAKLAEIIGDELKCGDETASVSTGEWHRLSAAVHFASHTYDIYLDGKLTFQNLSFNEEVQLLCYWRTMAYGGEATGCVHFDNMRIYDGKKPRTIDGPNTVYKNLEFENQKNWGINWQQTNGNSLTWEQEENGNGYLRFCKSVENKQMLMDINGVSLASKHIVYEIDVWPEDENFAGALFWLREDVGSTQITTTLVEVVSGSLKYGETRVPMNIGEWNRVSAVVDFVNSRYDIYLNGELAFENMGIRTDLQSPSIWRVLGYNWGPLGAIRCDNMRIYDGTELRDLGTESPDESVVFSDEKALAFLKNKIALQPWGGVLYYNNEKVNVKDSVAIDGEEVLVTTDVFAKLFGQTPVESGDTITVGTAVFTIGSKTMQLGSDAISMEAAPKREGGMVWLPISAYGENAVAQGCYLGNEYGLYVVSTEPFDAASSPVKEANLYLFFPRKSAAELKAMLLANNNNDLTTHPRLFTDAEGFETLRGEIESDSYKASWFQSIRLRADALLGEAPLEYVISNGRLLDVANTALTRAEVLGMCWQITREEKYATRLIAELDAISQFADWHPEHTLDTGTMAMAAAIAYDWGYDAMTAEQRTTFADRLFELGLKTAHKAYYGTADYSSWWTNTETNWGGVVNAGFMDLALVIAEKDPDYAMDIVEKAKRSMEFTIYRIAPDGAWYEGPGYWSYLFQSLSYALAGYESVLGEADETLNFKGMDGFAKYQLYFSDPSGNVNNFHDSDEGPIGCFGMFYLAKKFNQPSLMNYRAEFIAEQNQTPTVYDLLWYDVNAKNNIGTDDLALDYYYRETELVTMRQDWESENALWASVHGGSINTAHDHIDAGTFVMNLGGIRWAIDLPKEPFSYVSDAENPSIKAGYNSYYFYRRKGEGHNIVVINPDNELEMDQTQSAKIVEMESGVGRSYTVVDLSDVYRNDVNSYLRGFLVSDGRSALTVRDEIDLKKENSELYWFMHTEGTIIIEDDHTATILQDGKQLKLQFVTDAAESELMVMNAEKLEQSPHFEESANPDVQKIALKLTASGKVNITVKMSLVGEAASSTAPETSPIAQWNVSGDNEIAPASSGCASRLTSIQMNGKTLAGFDPEVFHYSYGLGKTETDTKVSAKGNGRVDVLSHTLLNGNELKEIRVYDENGRYTSYTVEIEPFSPYSVSQYNRYPVVASEASKEQIEPGVVENRKEHSYDANMDTRWSAEGDGEWIIHDLGEEKTIDAFGVAEWMGDRRKFYFDLEVSLDGEEWTTVVSEYQTSGTSEDIEVIPLEQSVQARYVRYVGHGNSVNQWNNVIELATYVLKQAPTPDPDPDPTPDPILPVRPSVPSGSGSTSSSKFPFSDVGKNDDCYDAVKYLYENGIMNGTGDTKFSPDLELTRGMVVTILYRMEGEPSTSGTKTFSDVAPGRYYSKAVEWAAEVGVVYGMPDGTFKPDQAVTREQLAAIISRYAAANGIEVYHADTLAATDVVSNWAREDVAWAVAEGILTPAQTANAVKNANRAEVAMAIYTYLTKTAK